MSVDGIKIQKASEVLEVDALDFGLRAPVTVRPPPKWKLAFVTWLAVFSVVFCVSNAGIPALISLNVDGYHSVTTVLVLIIVVVPILYAIAPVLTFIFAWWLRIPRPKYTCEPMRSLDQGFHLFVPRPPVVDPKLVKQLAERVQQLEGTVNRLRMASTSQHRRMCDAGLDKRPRIESGSASSEMVPVHPPDLQKLKEEVDQAGPRDLRKNLPVTCVAHHHVRWEHEDDFRLWCAEFRTCMKLFPGFLSLSTLHGKADGLAYSQEFVNIWKFRTWLELEVFMRSQERLRMIRQLGLWLESPSQITLAQERYMHDVFSELFVFPGEDAPARHPPIWKSAFLVICGLTMCVWPVNTNLGPVLARHGLQLWSQTLILTMINVCLNTYICLPFCLFLFGGWLMAPREPAGCFGRFLDRGFPHMAFKVLSALLVYGGLAALQVTDAVYCLHQMEDIAAAQNRC